MTGPAASIALHALLFPSLAQVSEKNPDMEATVETIKHALEKAEASNPGLSHDFVDLILEKTQSKGGQDLTEKLLREAHRDVQLYSIDDKTPELTDLSNKAKALKRILSTIPDEVQNRTRFLGIIRKIAESIKDMLDAVNAVATNNADLIAPKAEELQQQRKMFVRGSKRFSDTLKQYFTDNKVHNLFRSAHRLINETNSLMRTVKSAL
ncbi:hypothetical protein PTSG_07801 [Salpingoeca rosetta]|uniref:Programmed cell death protein 10 dimerisation domain-containing protein n=1 Tax=Salpingoeca rosetta (strain ATCC 50818 / BSB-021) TaxID=946362 RepID=F2UGD1_SALR5|nr:uncharacterized protein PTSG_07801 [Salpingoeca rosetta]EGD75681.1 hypothetical protein PTSG_07801 [Salpingoeca rosetta]|eukprot:XP_004991602.1 hypothetical protein PTSG_07801 [Salpingoeca rosetta]